MGAARGAALVLALINQATPVIGTHDGTTFDWGPSPPNGDHCTPETALTPLEGCQIAKSQSPSVAFFHDHANVDGIGEDCSLMSPEL